MDAGEFEEVNVPEEKEPLKNDLNLLKRTSLDIIDIGKGLKMQSERPHLVSLGRGRLSIAITLLPINEGETKFGLEDAPEPQDIILQGPDVATEHCYIENIKGLVTLYPCGSLCTMDGFFITQPTKLTQGCTLCLGQSNYFRFNHPAEANRMRNMRPDIEETSISSPSYVPDSSNTKECWQSKHNSNVRPVGQEISSFDYDDENDGHNMDTVIKNGKPLVYTERTIPPPSQSFSTSPSALPFLPVNRNIAPSSSYSPQSFPMISKQSLSDFYHPFSIESPAYTHSYSSPPIASGSQMAMTIDPYFGRRKEYVTSSRGQASSQSFSPRNVFPENHLRLDVWDNMKSSDDAPLSPLEDRFIPVTGRHGTESASMPSSPRLARKLNLLCGPTGYSLSGREKEAMSEAAFGSRSRPRRVSENSLKQMGLYSRSLPRLHKSGESHLVPFSLTSGRSPESPKMWSSSDETRELGPKHFSIPMKESLNYTHSNQILLPLSSSPVEMQGEYNLASNISMSPRNAKKMTLTSSHPYGKKDHLFTFDHGRKEFHNGSGSCLFKPIDMLVSLSKSIPSSPLDFSASDMENIKMMQEVQHSVSPPFRKRTNSISSVSGNEEDLMDYHQRQKEERLREQEMERLERQRLETILNLCSEYSKSDTDNTVAAVTNIEKISEELHKLTLSQNKSVSPPPERKEHSFDEAEAKTYIRTSHSSPSMSDFSPSKGRRSMKHSGPIDLESNKELNHTRDWRFLQQAPCTSAENSPKHPADSLSYSLELQKNDFEGQLNPFGSSMDSNVTDDGECRTLVERNVKEKIIQMEEECRRILNNVEEIQQKVKDLDNQMAESSQEMEMERALLEGEQDSETTHIQHEKDVLGQLHRRIADLEASANSEKAKEKTNLKAEKEKIERLQDLYSELKTQLHNCPESMREGLQEQLKRGGEQLDMEVKRYEDFEFQQLERESKLEEEKENNSKQLLGEIGEYQHSIETREKKLTLFKNQVNQIVQQAELEREQFLKEKNNLLVMLHREKENLLYLEKTYCDTTGGRGLPINSNILKENFRIQEERKKHQKEGLYLSDTIPRKKNSLAISSQFNSATLGRNVTSKAHLPLVQSNSCGSMLVHNMTAVGKDSENRRHQGQKGHRHHQLNEEQRQRILAQSSNYLDNSHLTDNGYKDSTFETLSLDSSDSMETNISACSPDNISSASTSNVAKIEEMERLLKEAQAEKAWLIETKEREMEAKKQALEEEKRRREDLEKRLQEETQRRQQLIDKEVKMREKQRSQARPLTRYLPVRKEDFDLRSHIETAGHNVETCYHVSLTEKTCRGFLIKMGGKIKTWKKRWFVFDRTKRTLSYYADKHETKLKGVIYFQAIEEVYYDHLKSAHKSPNPSLTFSVKTRDRIYYMVAPSPETMRIWMDVIVTGAEGYTQFML
ncbi:pleckstrin homology-like domain family B member 2 isoform X2 [Callorhinchus milii]|uniref:pleckstrin homology-like domain family B member 2 isoform X2 n=1 Tax=Callorhinchus milii TaxID=7868 RepID=UPI001C3FEB01|nr:pleckstrin homology-like domain family B member 2 isoform X2 [Callorhinchus milii]